LCSDYKLKARPGRMTIEMEKTASRGAFDGAGAGSRRSRMSLQPSAQPASEPRSPRKSFLRKNFTLIELMVVVSIIAILASILLPALGKARGTARSVACLCNLKNLGIAQFEYTESQGDWLLPWRQVTLNDKSDWYYVLSGNGIGATKYEYGSIRRDPNNSIGNHKYGYYKEFMCPESRMISSPAPGRSADPIQYGQNALLTGIKGSGSCIRVANLRHLKAPSDVIQMADSWYGQGQLIFAGCMAFRHGSGSGDDDYRQDSLAPAPASAKANILYGDMHAMGMTYRELITYKDNCGVHSQSASNQSALFGGYDWNTLTPF